MTPPADTPRTLVLNGSPRPDGNTMALARLFLDAMPGEREVVSAYDAAVAACTACGACAGGGPCVIGDAMPAIGEKIARADIVAVASPLHFTSLTAPLVALISRWQSYWEARRAGGDPLGGKRRLGVVIATGGSDYPAMFECARRVAAAGFVTLGIEYCGMLCVSGLDAGEKRPFSPDVRREAEALAAAALARWRET